MGVKAVVAIADAQWLSQGNDFVMVSAAEFWGRGGVERSVCRNFFFGELEREGEKKERIFLAAAGASRPGTKPGWRVQPSMTLEGLQGETEKRSEGKELEGCIGEIGVGRDGWAGKERSHVRSPDGGASRKTSFHHASNSSVSLLLLLHHRLQLLFLLPPFQGIDGRSSLVSWPPSQ